MRKIRSAIEAAIAPWFLLPPSYEIMRDHVRIISLELHGPAEKNRVNSSSTSAVSPRINGEVFTASILLESPSFSIEDLIRIFESLNVWETLKRKHDIHPERGDRIIIPDFGRALDPPKNVPNWRLIGAWHAY